jgi:hypothetical protein
MLMVAFICIRMPDLPSGQEDKAEIHLHFSLPASIKKTRTGRKDFPPGIWKYTPG